MAQTDFLDSFFTNTKDHKDKLKVKFSYSVKGNGKLKEVGDISIDGINNRDKPNVHMLARNLVPDFATFAPEWKRAFVDVEFPDSNDSDFQTVYLEYLVNASQVRNFKEYLEKINSIRCEKDYLKKINLTGCEKDCSFSMNTFTPLAVGTGEDHSDFGGIVHLHLYGFPYIPYRSVKGAVRACFRESGAGSYFENECCIDRDNENLKNLKTYCSTRHPESEDVATRLFGDMLFGEEAPEDHGSIKNKGILGIFDAYPDDAQNNDLKLLSIYNQTPHHKKYNNMDSLPMDNDDPIPLNYLVVDKGVKFLFAFELNLGHNWTFEDVDGNEKEISIGTIINKEKACQWVRDFIMATLEQGIGGKTGSGLGYFETVQ